jgi:ZIP family zinc transporter
MLDALLGFTAGIMLAGTAFSLLVPALDLGSVWEVLAGFGLGAIVLLALDSAIPHVHARYAEPGHTLDPRRRQALLLVSALTIHNVPEGLAVGVAFAAGGSELGIPIALAIGIQNIPEGFAAAAPSPPRAPSWPHAWAQRPASSSRPPPSRLTPPSSLPRHSSRWALGFAAGAMLYVVADELIPESHARGNERIASGALLGGFALMMLLDNAFG